MSASEREGGTLGKVMVTGGAGFIGSNLVAALTATGHEVVVVDNLSSGCRSNLEPLPHVRFINGDVRDGRCLADAVDGVRVIFHLAASVGNKRSIENPLEDADVNVLGTLRLLEAARAARVDKIIVSSSAGIFGELKTLPIREDHPIEPDSPYGCTKLAEEKLALAYAKIHGLQAVCLRYFNVFGRNQRFDAYGNVIPIFVFKLLRGEPLTIFGDGQQTRDFVHVNDVVQANLRAAAACRVSRAYNIGSGTRITIDELVALIRDVAGIDPVVQYGSPRPGDVRHSLADITAASRDFGFAPATSMRAGLADYVAWARTEVRT